jgi:hypothetical protein
MCCSGGTVMTNDDRSWLVVTSLDDLRAALAAEGYTV